MAAHLPAGDEACSRPRINQNSQLCALTQEAFYRGMPRTSQPYARGPGNPISASHHGAVAVSSASAWPDDLSGAA
jgi:hypothetical protein